MIINVMITGLQEMFLNLDPTEQKLRLEKMVLFNHATKSWQCRICDLPLTRKAVAIDHVEAQHLQILTYPCDYCHQSFTSKSNRRKHVHTVHREQNKLAKILYLDQ